MMATKRIKLIKAWNMFAPGAEVEFQTSVADLLIQRGRAEEVKPVQAPAPVIKPKKSKRKGK